MTNTKSTKRALLTSVMALFLCFTMLLGTTYAWFTDSVTSANNVITAGDLDVELYNALADNLTAETKIKDGGLFEDVTYWEPGMVAYENLTIVNEGSLALKYVLSVNFFNENTLNGKGLSDKLQVSFIPDGLANSLSRDDVLSRATKNGFEPMASFAQNGNLLPKKHDHIDDSIKTDDIPVENVTYAIVIYWEPSEDDNDWNVNNSQQTSDGKPLHIELGVNLFATQMVAEDDSFGTDYDKDAEYVIATGESSAFVGANIDGGVANYGELTVTGGSISQKGNQAFYNEGDAELKDVTLNMTESIGYITNSRGDNSVTIFENVNATSTGGGVNVWNGKAVFKSGTITTNAIGSNPRHVFYVADNGELTIEDGTFTFNPTNLSRKGSYLVADGAGSIIKVYGGTFGKQSTRTSPVQELNGGEVKIYGGTFAWDPSAWLAEGCSTVKDGNNWFVFKGETLVTTQNEFENAINAGKTRIYLVKGDYKLPNVKDTEITLVGAGPETVVDYSKMGGYQEVSGSSFVFENMTVVNDTKGYPYPGLQHITSVKYVDCYIKGTVNLFAPATFTNCTLDSNGAEHNVVTYGSDSVEFTNCKFVYGDRAVNCYAENAATRDVYVTFDNCDFTKVAGKESVGAIETNSSFMNSLHLTIDNCTINEGEIAYISEYDETAGAKTKITVDGKEIYVVAVGNKWATEAFDTRVLNKALTADKQNITVILLKDVKGNFGNSSELGSNNTQTITINGNGHKLTLTMNYMPGFWLSNDQGKLIINNTIITTERESGTWDVYDINFNNNTELNNVEFEKAVSLSGVGDTYVLKNVSITETNDYYALWISANGASVTIDGLNIESAGRGIKIDEQYQGTNVAKVNLKVSNATFKTEKKAAIMVCSSKGADIDLHNVNIDSVKADSVNAVWNDSDATQYLGFVNVTGGTIYQEN